MNRTLNQILALTILTLFVAGACLAQGPGGGQNSAFREEHKYTFQLMQTVRHIGEIDKDPKHALTPAQAKQVLAVLKPIRSKTKLTQDQAKQALKSLKPIFTVDQLNAMAKIKAPARRMGQGGPGGPGGQGRPGGAQGNRPRMDSAAMKDFNPFYARADKSDPGTADRAKRMNGMFSGLEKKAKQAKAAPAKAKAKK